MINQATQNQVIQVYFVLQPNSLILDWAGPAETLRIANQILRGQQKPEAFALHFVGSQTCAISSVGAQISGLSPLPDLARIQTTSNAPIWLVLVGQVAQKGETLAAQFQEDSMRLVLHWVRGLRFKANHLELMCVCAGSLIAAQAGALAGRNATTHHQYLAELKRLEPSCNVIENRILVQDDAIFTSAGVTTGIDLFLHRIAATCGAVLTAQVAQNLVLALRRGLNDPELSPFLEHRNHLHPALHRVQDAIALEPQANWTVAKMATIAAVSDRHLARLFAQYANVAPLYYLRHLRLSVAKAALISGFNVTQAANMAGFSEAQLRRAWQDFGMNGSPSTYASKQHSLVSVIPAKAGIQK